MTPTPELTFALFGHPVRHSSSPAMFRAAFRAAGLGHRYEARDLLDAVALESAVGELRSGTTAGANVTLPHKVAILAHCDELSATAADTGAANVVQRSDVGRLIAHNTDVAALVGRIPAGIQTALVLGAGGASLAVVAALRARGAARIIVAARSFDRAPADPRRAAFDRAGAETVGWNARVEAERIDCVVQATSAGIREPQTSVLIDAVPWKLVAPSALAIDLVYGAAPTLFVEHARRIGLRAEDGVPMLVAQAEATYAIWLGVSPPRGVMLDACAQEMRRRAEDCDRSDHS